MEILHAHDIELLADIRTVPGSRRMPQFSKANLEQELPSRGLAYGVRSLHAHRLTPFARVEGTAIVYDGPADAPLGTLAPRDG